MMVFFTNIPTIIQYSVVFGWLPLKETVYLDTSFCNKSNREELHYIVEFKAKQTSVIANKTVSEITIISRVRNKSWIKNVFEFKKSEHIPS